MDKEVGWVVATVGEKKLNSMNNRVKSGHDVHKYIRWTSIPLQGLNKQLLTVTTYV